MSEKPSLADVRRANLARARASKKAASSRFERKVDRLQQGIDALLDAQTQLIKALGELVVKLAHPAVAVQLAEPLSARTLIAAHLAGEPEPTSVFEAAHVDYLNTRAAMANGGNGALREPDEIPRGMETEPIPPLDYAAEMAAELAEMADEIPPPPDELTQWTPRIALYRGNGLWLPDWGPRPGQDGCRAPPELLSGRG